MDETLYRVAKYTFSGHPHLIAVALDDLTARELKALESLVGELQREIALAQVRKGA